MKKTTLILIAIVGVSATIFSSCKKSTPQSTLTFVNDTYTPISITVNGSSRTIAVNNSVSYVANVGSTANI